MSRSPRRILRFFATNPYQQLLAIAWRYAEGMRGRYLLIYLLFFGVNAVLMTRPVIFGLYVNYLQTGEGNLLRGTWIYAGLYLATHFIFWAFQWPARLMERKLAFQLGERLLMDTYDKVVHLPLDWHRRHHSGDTINRIRKAFEALKNFFDQGFLYFQTLVRMLISIGAIIAFSPLFGGVAGIAGILIVVAVLAFDRPIIAATQETNERENDLLASLTDRLGNIITVTTLRLGKRTAEQIRLRVERVLPPFLRNTRLNEQKWFTMTTFIALMYVVIVLGYFYQHYTPGEVFLVGGLVTLIGYVHEFSRMFSGFTGQYNQIIRYRADLAAIDPIEVAYAEQARPSVSAATAREAADLRDWTALTVRDLHFRYDTGQEGGAGVFDIALQLPRGGRIALIGPSGSGKTTLLYNLRGLYPPQHIEVAFNPAVATRDPAQLFEQTTLIPQNPEIFEDTIRVNLTMGLPHTVEEIENAIYLAAVADVIVAAEEGLDTPLSEGGANLSGGQRQRLSIARGLLAADTSTLLLLDEPTSSLDPQTELLVYQRIFAAYPKKTIVSTLHRLHLLRFFDYIYYLEEGRIQSEGSLEELLAGSPHFRAMWEEQMAGV